MCLLGNKVKMLKGGGKERFGMRLGCLKVMRAGGGTVVERFRRRFFLVGGRSR